MDDNTIENSPEGPADRPIQNPNLTDKRTQTSQNCQAQALCCAACVSFNSFNSLICKKTSTILTMHSTRFLPIPSCSYDSLQSDNPPSGAHSQTSGEHHAAKRLLPQQKMRHVQNRPQHPNPGNTTWRYIINTLSTLHALVQSCIKSNDSNDTVSSQLCALAAPDHTHAPQLGGTLRRTTLRIAPPSFCCQGLPGQHT